MVKKEKRENSCDQCARYNCRARKTGIRCTNFVELTDKAKCADCRNELVPGQDYAIINGRLLCSDCMKGPAYKKEAKQESQKARAPTPSAAHSSTSVEQPPAPNRPPSAGMALALVPAKSPEVKNQGKKAKI